MAQYFGCCVSEPLLEDYVEVLGRAQFGLDEQKTARVMRRFRRAANLVVPRKSLRITADPDDDIGMECALEARADFVVMGNIRHFPPRFQDIRVTAPRQFLTVLA